MGAMGGLPEEKKYVLKIEVSGPKTPEEAGAFRLLVRDLQQKFGASVDFKERGKSEPKTKRKPKSKPKSKPKRKPKRK